MAKRGRVVGAVVLHRPFEAAFADRIPLLVADVEIEGTEGKFILIGNLSPAMPVDQAIGKSVDVTFRDQGGMALPMFTLC